MKPWLKHYAAYLFDLDGTLIDTAPDINAALNHCLMGAGLPPVEESLTRHWVGHGARVLISQALAHAQTQIDVDAMLEEFLSHYTANIAVHSQPYPEVVNTLEHLAAHGAKLAVVTNKLTVLTERLLEEIGLRQHFDLVVCGDTTATPKPDPAPVHFALQVLAVGAAETLFVGDSETDVRAAQAAGVAVVCMRDGYNHGIDVTTLQPTAVIDRFDELKPA